MRRTAAVLALLLGLGLVAVPGAGAGGARGTGYDARIGSGTCALLGRVHVAGRGCSRDRCVPGARIYKGAVGSETCSRGRAAYATAVEYRRCRELGRRWVAQVNWCASNPRRTTAVIAGARQCAGARSTYVTHTEREGRYDECLSPAVVGAVQSEAARTGVSFERLAWQRSAVNCRYRHRRAYVDGQCVRVPAETPKQPGGVLVVGDSIAWRGTDELGRLRPDWTVDGIPSRRFTDLAPRLDAYLADHEAPTGLVVELGTNATSDYTRGDLVRVLDRLPASTRIMLVLPYRANPHRPPAIQPSSTRYAAWMRTIARTRPATCAADWRALVARHPRVLGDGVHPASASEGYWARWLVREWGRC